jgi:hypothetical protein
VSILVHCRVENLPTESVPGPPSTAEREQLRSELERLDQKILLIAEDEAIVHQQLQAVEMNIQAESGMMPLPVSFGDDCHEC